MDFEFGQRFLMRSGAHEVRVKRVLHNATVVEWPWGEADPESRYRWNGSVALPSDPPGSTGSRRRGGSNRAPVSVPWVAR